MSRIMRNYATGGCYSERSEESHGVALACRMRFFTPLRYVQNDMIEDGLSGNRIHSSSDTLRHAFEGGGLARAVRPSILCVRFDPRPLRFAKGTKGFTGWL